MPFVTKTGTFAKDISVKKDSWGYSLSSKTDQIGAHFKNNDHGRTLSVKNREFSALFVKGKSDYNYRRIVFNINIDPKYISEVLREILPHSGNNNRIIAEDSVVIDGNRYVYAQKIGKRSREGMEYDLDSKTGFPQIDTAIAMERHKITELPQKRRNEFNKLDDTIYTVGLDCAGWSNFFNNYSIDVESKSEDINTDVGGIAKEDLVLDDILLSIYSGVENKKIRDLRKNITSSSTLSSDARMIEIKLSGAVSKYLSERGIYHNYYEAVPCLPTDVKTGRKFKFKHFDKKLLVTGMEEAAYDDRIKVAEKIADIFKEKGYTPRIREHKCASQACVKERVDITLDEAVEMISSEPSIKFNLESDYRVQAWKLMHKLKNKVDIKIDKSGINIIGLAYMQDNSQSVGTLVDNILNIKELSLGESTVKRQEWVDGRLQYVTHSLADKLSIAGKAMAVPFLAAGAFCAIPIHYITNRKVVKKTGALFKRGFLGLHRKLCEIIVEPRKIREETIIGQIKDIGIEKPTYSEGCIVVMKPDCLLARAKHMAAKEDTK